jgi:hypothetical protein
MPPKTAKPTKSNIEAIKKTTFTALSSLAQVIHQDPHRFVVISYPNDSDIDPIYEPLSNTLAEEDDEIPEGERLWFEVGEVGGARRWWRGQWTMNAVRSIPVCIIHDFHHAIRLRLPSFCAMTNYRIVQPYHSHNIYQGTTTISDFLSLISNASGYRVSETTMPQPTT